MYLSGVAVGLVALIHLLSLLASRGEWVLGYASSITASDVVVQTNQERAAQGLPPLTVNQQLSQAALAKGQDMLADQYWAHFAPDGTEPWDFIRDSGYSYVAAGENLARDFSNTNDMVAAWMASPTHKANIMSPKYREIGIAVIDGQFQGVETTLVVQMFGSPRQAPAVITDQAPIEDVNLPQGTQPALAEAGSAEPATRPIRVDVSQSGSEVGNQPTTAVLAESNTNPGVTEVRLTVPDIAAAPLLSPLQLSKAFFLAIVLLIVVTLVYDTIIVSHRNTLRFVGKNTAHILFLLLIGYLVLFFKGGLIT